jgi:hypothetical protein
MNPTEFLAEDICDFAERLGLQGIDADLFYEAYYDLDSDHLEVELDEEYEVVYH